MGQQGQNTEDRYWLMMGETPYGPVEAAEIHARLATGEVSWQTLACPLGSSTWLPLVQIPGIGPPVQSPPSEELQLTPPEPRSQPSPALSSTIPTAVPMTGAGARGQELSPSPSWLDKLATVGGGVGILCWLTNEFVGRSLLIVAGLLWLMFAARVLWTGAAMSFSGKLTRSGKYRIAAVVVGLSGLLALTAGLMGTVRRIGFGIEEAPLDRTKVVDFGNEEQVYYRGELHPQAEHLGQVLKEIGYFNGKSPKAAQVFRRGDVWVVHLYMTATACTDTRIIAMMRELAGVQLAALAFPDSLVEICLCDDSMNVRNTIPVGPAGRISVSPKEHVYYKGALHEAAQKLTTFYRGVLSGKNDMVFILSKRNASWVICPMHIGADAGPEIIERVQQMPDYLSTRVFDGERVEIDLFDNNFNVARTFASR